MYSISSSCYSSFFSLSEPTRWMESNLCLCFKSSTHWSQSLNLHKVFQLIALIDPPHFLVARHSVPLPCTLGQTDWAWSQVLKGSDSEMWVGIPHGFIPFGISKTFSAKAVWLTVFFIRFSKWFLWEVMWRCFKPQSSFLFGWQLPTVDHVLHISVPRAMYFSNISNLGPLAIE